MDSQCELQRIIDGCLRISEQAQNPSLKDLYRRQADYWRELASKAEFEREAA
jgi:hypothetical protein